MRRKKPKTHDDCVQHFQKRCMERVGYLLHQRFLKEEMQAGHLKVYARQSNNRTLFRLPRKYGRDLVVVYDKLRHAFVTILFLDEMKGINPCPN